MSNSYIQVPIDSSGKKSDHERYTVGGETVDRQRVQAGGSTKVVNGSVTRPADTAVYAAGDVLTDSTSAPTKITFAGVAREGAQSGIITSATLIDSANATTKPVLELWLFDTSFAVDNDNALFTPTDAELETAIGVITFPTQFVGDAGAAAAGNVAFQALGLNIGFKCTASLLDIYGIFVVRNAYTPVSGEKFTVRLTVLQD